MERRRNQVERLAGTMPSSPMYQSGRLALKRHLHLWIAAIRIAIAELIVPAAVVGICQGRPCEVGKSAGARAMQLASSPFATKSGDQHTSITMGCEPLSSDDQIAKTARNGSLCVGGPRADIHLTATRSRRIESQDNALYV